MPRESISAKTGNADLKKLGHTSTDQYGQNPRAKNPNRKRPRDEGKGK